jgi:hypothetical protein
MSVYTDFWHVIIWLSARDYFEEGLKTWNFTWRKVEHLLQLCSWGESQFRDGRISVRYNVYVVLLI